MPVPFLGLRALFLSTMVGIVPTEPSRRGTGPQNRGLLHRKAPIERQLTRSVAALLTGSRADEFISDAPYGRAQLEIGDGYR
jgi:hypothetical protein